MGATLVLVGLILIVVGSIAISVKGVVDQGDELTTQLTTAFATIDSWLEDLDVDAGVGTEPVAQAEDFTVNLVSGLAGWFTSAFSGVAAFLTGTPSPDCWEPRCRHDVPIPSTT